MRSVSSTRSSPRRVPVKSATARYGRQRWTTWSGYGQGSAALTPSEELREARATLLGAGLEPAALRQGLSDAADSWFKARLVEQDGVAVVAVGGYGRRELPPGSHLGHRCTERTGARRGQPPARRTGRASPAGIGSTGEAAERPARASGAGAGSEGIGPRRSGRFDA